ncbi:MAG: hypothetical protein ACI8XO_002301 [Verrucomicrobiales bacterium]|jgi:hypothetical protein
MRTATPLFAMQTSFKYANNDATTVVRDLEQHGRKVTRSYVLEVAADVASVVDEKDNWIGRHPAWRVRSGARWQARRHGRSRVSRPCHQLLRQPLGTVLGESDTLRRSRR